MENFACSVVYFKYECTSFDVCWPGVHLNQMSSTLHSHWIFHLLFPKNNDYMVRKKSVKQK